MCMRCKAKDVWCTARGLVTSQNASAVPPMAASRAHHGRWVLLLGDLAVAQAVRGELVLQGRSLRAQVGAGCLWGLRLGHRTRLHLLQHMLWMLHCRRSRSMPQLCAPDMHASNASLRLHSACCQRARRQKQAMHSCCAGGYGAAWQPVRAWAGCICWGCGGRGLGAAVLPGAMGGLAEELACWLGSLAACRHTLGDGHAT